MKETTDICLDIYPNMPSSSDKIPTLTENMIKSMLSEDTAWKQDDDFWTGSTKRYTKAPFGFDVNVFNNQFGDFEDDMFKCVTYKSVIENDSGIPTTGQEILFEFMVNPKDYENAPVAEVKPTKKSIEFILEDIPQLNKIFGIRGTLRMTTDISYNDVTKEYKEGSTYCFFKSSFAEEETEGDYAYKMIKKVLLLRGLTLEFLFSLEENTIHNLSLAQVQPVLDVVDVFLVYSSDQHQTTSSYQLEGVVSNIDAAHTVVQKIFKEYGCETKSIVMTTVVDSNDFADYEVYDYENGLEWKHEDSGMNYGDLSQTELELDKECANA
jgi:hypothetical protein